MMPTKKAEALFDFEPTAEVELKIRVGFMHAYVRHSIHALSKRSHEIGSDGIVNKPISLTM